MKFFDRLGWPVERIQGRPFTNLLRLLIHTRRITWPNWSPQATCVCLLLLGMAAWTYVADNGVQAWTDDPARVPAAYEAREVELEPLATYPRLTCDGTCPRADED